MSWEKLKLEEIGLITSGGTPSTGNPAYWNGEIPWITPKDLSNFENRYIENGERNITDEGLKNSSAKLVKEKSVLLSSRAPIGYLAIAQNDLTTNQGFKNITPNEKCDYLYLFYCLKNNVEYLKSLGIGATYPELSSSRLKEIQIPVPSLPTQRRIASILSAYDDLIENNLKRIKLLEEKAFLRYKQILKEEKLEKHILSDFGDIITGKTPSTTIADYFGDVVPFIKTPDMHNQIFIEHTDQMLSELGAKSQEKKFLPPLSLCVSCIGTAGVVGITSKPSQTNQQINSIVFYEPKNVYFFYALMSQMKEHLDALGSNGSTFTNVNKNKFENMEVFVPNQKTLNDFAEEFEAPFKLILTLQKQNTKLREARDILLPKLMNGQIEV